MHGILALLFASAFIPLAWDVETSKARTANFEAYHGETLSLAADMYSYGDKLDLRGMTAVLYWQTNGMDTVYWSTNATVVGTNTLSATFTGAMDPGSPVVSGFIGIVGENYHAAFTLRFRGSPGAVPNEIKWPSRILDLSTITVTNAPWSLSGRTFNVSNTTNCLTEIIKALGGTIQ